MREHPRKADAHHGMVASSQILASEAGLQVLKEGGTAADACVAMDAVLHVTEPTSTGLGGDMFALHFDGATGAVTALNGSGRSPRGLSPELLRGQGLTALPRDHGHTVTVPGVCAGWFDLLRRHGSMPPARLLAPAVELAAEGFPVGAVTAASWERGFAQLRSSELSIAGRPPRAGEIFRNPGLARALRAVAEGGPEAFYGGELGPAIVAAVQRAGGAMTLEDMEAHRSTWVDPIRTTYRGIGVWECPPNGQGLVTLLALNILEGFDAAGPPLSVGRWHRQIEALRVAFADAHRYLADPQAAEVPVERLLSKAYAAERRAAIRPDRAAPVHAALRRASDTVYLCAVDERRNACSFISSHFMGFGTGIVPEGWGFVLQNRGLGFALEPGHANALGPGKRPYHTIIPGLLTRPDGTLWGPFGVMGGLMQPQGHVQVVMALVDDGAGPQEALERPRFSIAPEAPDSPVSLEAGVPASIGVGLRGLGHGIIEDVPSFGRATFGRGQIILRDPDDALHGGSDPRADGCALGF